MTRLPTRSSPRKKAPPRKTSSPQTRQTPLQAATLAIRVIDERIKREERTPRATSPPQQQRRASLPGQDVTFEAQAPRAALAPRRTPRATSPPRGTAVRHKKDRRCSALINDLDLWKYAKGRDVSRKLYETVIRPCFVYRLLDAANQEGRARRQRSDRKGKDLEQNWSHDVVLAQYGRIAKRMENRDLANVLEAIPRGVSSSLDRYLGPPSRQEQIRNRRAAFAHKDDEAQSSRNTYRRLKALSSRFSAGAARSPQ
jgi:hypothetical protein